MKKILIVVLVLLLIPVEGCISKSGVIKIDAISNSVSDTADVYIDGTFIGKTPLTYRMSYGKHKFTFKGQFESNEKEINIDRYTKSVAYDTYTTTISVTSDSSGPFAISIEGKDAYYDIGYTVYLDGKFTGKTLPVTITGISKGNHTIKLVGLGDSSELSLDVKGDMFLNLRGFNPITSKDFPVVVENYRHDDSFSTYNVVFDKLPVIDICCSAAAIAYSGVFVGDKIIISGKTKLKTFYIQYPSGKLVAIPTKPFSKEWREFSKEVLFDEAGRYNLLDENKKQFDQFEVLYKAIVLPPAKTVSQLFGTQVEPYGIPAYSRRLSDAIAIHAGKESIIKLFIVDSSGNPIVNKTIVYNEKTDSNGIARFKVEGIKDSNPIGGFIVNGKQGGAIFYGDLLAGVYDYAIFDRDGHILSTSMQFLKFQTDVKLDIRYDGDDIYMPYGVIGSFNLKGGKAKVFDNQEYVAVNTIVPASDTAIMVTDETIEFYKLKGMMP
ncbi:MAG: PEGA domain-containing protein [Caldisericaceae bacterium]